MLQLTQYLILRKGMKLMLVSMFWCEIVNIDKNEK